MVKGCSYAQTSRPTPHLMQTFPFSPDTSPTERKGENAQHLEKNEIKFLHQSFYIHIHHYHHRHFHFSLPLKCASLSNTLHFVY